MDIENYNANKDFLFKNGFAMHILFSRYFMCSSRDKFSFSKTWRNFIVLALSIWWLLTFKVGGGEGMLYFLSGLWNKENLVFPTFIDSFFPENHSLIPINLTISNNVFMLLCSKNKLVSSANIIGTSTFKELRRSFTYNIH